MDRNWGELLHFIYTEDEKWQYFKEDPGGIHDNTHPLVQRTGLRAADVQAALSFLKRHELITEDRDSPIELTKKGFEVAREREYQRNQVQHNFVLMLLTAVIAVSAMTQAFSAADIHPFLIQLTLTALLSLLLGFVIAPTARKYLYG